MKSDCPFTVVLLIAVVLISVGCAAHRAPEVLPFTAPPAAAEKPVTDKHCHWTMTGAACSGVDKLPAWAAYCVCTEEI